MAHGRPSRGRRYDLEKPAQTGHGRQSSPRRAAAASCFCKIGNGAMNKSCLPLSLFILCPLSLFAGFSHAQTSYPMITHTSPVAVQRGKTSEVTVSGQMDFSGVYKVLFEGQGLSAEIVPVPNPSNLPPQPKPAKQGKKSQRGSVNLKITVSPEAIPGV